MDKNFWVSNMTVRSLQDTAWVTSMGNKCCRILYRVGFTNQKASGSILDRWPRQPYI